MGSGVDSGEAGRADDAMLYLGYMYQFGNGVPQDYAEAMDWYRKSADKGESRAIFTLGEMYSDGKGVPQDFAEAYFWLNLSAVDSTIGTAGERDAVAVKLSPGKLNEVQER
jgi:uncharacterized protein